METNEALLELSIIKKIMEDSRKAAYESGIQGIFWSIVIAVTLILNYIILISRSGYQYIGIVWLVMMALGTAGSIIIGIKEKKTIKTRTFAGRVLMAVWLSIGVSNSVFAFAAVIAHAFNPLYIIPLDSIVLGVGFYITGAIQQMRLLKFLTWVWWLQGIFFLIFPGIHSILSFSVLLIVSILIPALENRGKRKLEIQSAVSDEKITMDSKQAELEISVIKKILEDSRNIVFNNGWHYIFWAIVVSTALITNYIMLLMKTEGDFIGWMWLVLMVGASITASLWERRADKRRTVKTFAGNMLGSLWFAGGAAMFTFGFVGTISGAYNPVYICPVISAVLGVTFFISGEIQQLKWQKFLSIGWWLGSILLFMYPSVHTLLIFAIMLFFLQAVPGYC